MSISYKEIFQPEKLVTQFHIRICDMCGQQSESSEKWTDEKSEFTNNNTIIELQEGETYPEISNLTKTICDLCPSCFKNKLIPWLESQGVTMETHDFLW